MTVKLSLHVLQQSIEDFRSLVSIRSRYGRWDLLVTMFKNPYFGEYSEECGGSLGRNMQGAPEQASSCTLTPQETCTQGGCGQEQSCLLTGADSNSALVHGYFIRQATRFIGFWSENARAVYRKLYRIPQEVATLWGKPCYNLLLMCYYVLILDA